MTAKVKKWRFSSLKSFEKMLTKNLWRCIIALELGTWEAIYLGAVPIVLKNTLADSIAADLPVWVVDSWDEVFDATDAELLANYRALREVPPKKAFFPYWLGKIATPTLAAKGPEKPH